VRKQPKKEKEVAKIEQKRAHRDWLLNKSVEKQRQKEREREKARKGEHRLRLLHQILIGN